MHDIDNKDNNNPFKPDSAYELCMVNWKLVEQLLLTTEQIKKNGSLIYKEPTEHADVFASRLKKTYLPIGFKEHLIRAVAKATRCKIDRKNIHPKLLPFFKESGDIDGEGNELQIIIGRIVSSLLTFGVGGGIVDSKKNTISNEDAEQWTAEDEKRGNIRPCFIHLIPTQVIGTREENGTISQIRVKSNMIVPCGDFGESEKVQVRVFKKDIHGVTYSIYEKEKNENKKNEKKIIIVTENQPLIKDDKSYFHHIPVVVGYASFEEKIAPFRAHPPLIRLAEQTISLLNAQSIYSSIVALAQVPIPIYSTTLESDELGISNETNEFSKDLQTGNSEVQIIDKGGDGIPPDKFYYADTGALKTGIEAGQKNCETIAKTIEKIGGESIYGKPHVTATANLLEQKSSDNLLQSVLVVTQDILNNALIKFGEWYNIPKEDVGSIEISKDISGIEEMNLRNKEELDRLFNEFQAGIISKETYLKERVARGGYINIVTLDDVDVELGLVTHEPFSG